MGICRSSLPFAMCLAALSGYACVYDGDDVCDEGQLLVERACVCGPGFAEAPDGRCEACSDNEEVREGSCECVEGFARNLDGQCQEIDTTLGVPCLDDSDCEGTDSPVCVNQDVDGYCSTVGCTSSDECAGEFACQNGEGGTFCRRPPPGLGLACETDADCEGFEASACDTFLTNSCFVTNCDLENDGCFEGFLCCDLSPFSSFGTPPSACVRPETCP